MQFQQRQVHCLGRPQSAPPQLMRIRIKATGKVTTATSYGFGWLVASGKIYTKHTAEYVGRA